MALELVLALTDLRKQLLLGESSKGTTAIQHAIQQNAQRPTIRQKRVIGLSLGHLRRHVGGRPAEIIDSRRALN
jgi:hypothetical protein